MIIRPGPVRQIVNNNISNTQNKNAEAKTPPIVKSEPSVKKAPEISRAKRNGQENRRVNNKKPVESNKKSAFEILMEED